MGFAENDPEGKLWFFSFAQAFQELGWIDGRNVRIDVKWDVSKLRPQSKVGQGVGKSKARRDPRSRDATDCFASARNTHDPDRIWGCFRPGRRRLRGKPFRPGKNITGFVFTEGEMGGKWLELLKEIAPSITRAAAIFDPDTAPGRGMYYLPSFEAAARSLKVEPIIARVHSDAEIETAIASLGREPGGGLVVIGDVFSLGHRGTIISAAARTKVPAIYFHSAFVREGGLYSYGPDNANLFRRAATYVDRILRVRTRLGFLCRFRSSSCA